MSLPFIESYAILHAHLRCLLRSVNYFSSECNSYSGPFVIINHCFNMSGNPTPPVKVSLRQRILAHNPFRHRAASPSPSLSSRFSQTVASSTAQTASSISTQAVCSSTALAVPVSSHTSETPASNTPTSSGSHITPHVIKVRNEPGQRVYDAAINALEEQDRATIEAIVVQEDVEGIKSVQDAVLAQQRKRKERQWEITVKGHSLELGVVAQSLSRLLDWVEPAIGTVSQVFGIPKPGIDLAASIAPLHIGVPVALIKALLGVVTFSHEEMENLLTGTKNAAYMLKKISLYFEYFKHVDIASDAKNLEDELAKSYSIVFVFLAVDYRIFNQKGPQRTLRLL